MATKNEIAKTQKSFSVALTEKLDSVSDALPKDFNKARFVQNALSLMNDNPDLAKYGQPQLIAGLMKGAFLGLDFYSKEAYLIPYGSKLNYQTDYRGEMKLAKKYSIRPIKNIYSEIVREGDTFETGVENNQRYVTYKPLPFNGGKIVGAFAVVEYEDGGIGVETMSLAELETTRKKSKASNSMAWKDFTTSMYRKTVIRRLCKYIERDFENAQQQSIYESEMEIETDVREIAKSEIEENANTEEFVIDGEIVE